MSSRPEAKSRKWAWIGWTTFVVVVIVGFIVLAELAGGGSDTGANTGTSPAPTSLVSKITSLPDSLFNSIGKGSVTQLPKSISAPALTADGKPHLVYIGAEYCPYCATERWPMIIALSRFGSFSGLGVTHSSSSDVYPSTQTFSFHGATYTSKYISFTGVETQTNQPDGAGGYTQLDKLSSELQSLLSTYDAAPYVASSAAGSIPFIDFGGKFLISGSTYSPQVLQGKSADQIADALKDPSSDIAKGAIGSANALTAAICLMTNNQPSSACSLPAVQSLETSISANK